MRYLITITVICFFFLGCYGVASIFQDGDILPGGDNSTDTTGLPVDTIITDTIPVDTLPLVLDTCDEYHDIVSAKFSTWAINLDGVIPSGYEFYYKKTGGQFIPIDIDSVLNQYGQSTTYYSGINIAGIVVGLDNPSHTISEHLYTFDAFGNIFEIWLTSSLLDFRGALTFDQFFALEVAHSNFHRMGFWNCGNFTQDQFNQIVDYLIDNCIDGSGNIIDFTQLPAGIVIDADRRGLLHLAHFTILG